MATFIAGASYPLYRPARSRWVRRDTFKVFYNVYPITQTTRDGDRNPSAPTLVRFHSKDRWLGDGMHYRKFTGQHTMTPMNRVLKVMRYYERRQLTHHWAYLQAQRIAMSFLFPEDWKASKPADASSQQKTKAKHA